MSNLKKKIVLAAAIVTLCFSGLSLLLELISIGGSVLLISAAFETGYVAQGIAYLLGSFGLMICNILLIVFSAMLCANPDKSGKYAQYKHKLLAAIIMSAVVIFIHLLTIILTLNILAILDILVVTTALVLFCVGFVKNKAEFARLLGQPQPVASSMAGQPQAASGTVAQPQSTVLPDGTVAPTQPQKKFDCDLDNVIDHKVFRIRQLHEDGIFTDEEMKELLVEVFLK